MKRSFLALFAPLCLLLTSCTYVACKTPVGEKAKAGIAEKIDGTWRIEDGVVYVKYIGDGNVLVAGVKEDKKGFKLNQQTVVVTTIGDDLYVNLPFPEEKPDRYMLLRLVAGPGKSTLVLYGPKSTPFTEAVRAGKLRGEIKEQSDDQGVTISDSAAMVEFISKQPTSALFNVEAPAVLTRIGEPKEKEKDKEKESKKK